MCSKKNCMPKYRFCPQRTRDATSSQFFQKIVNRFQLTRSQMKVYHPTFLYWFFFNFEIFTKKNYFSYFNFFFLPTFMFDINNWGLKWNVISTIYSRQKKILKSWKNWWWKWETGKARDGGRVMADFFFINFKTYLFF